MLSHQAVKLLLESCCVDSGLSRVQTTKHVYVCRKQINLPEVSFNALLLLIYGFSYPKHLK